MLLFIVVVPRKRSPSPWHHASSFCTSAEKGSVPNGCKTVLKLNRSVKTEGNIQGSKAKNRLSS